MDLEASLVERLHKLKQWQIEQQERLMRQQLVQRQKLSQEQLRLYKALNLPIQEIGLDDSTLSKSSCYEDAYLSVNTVDHIQDSNHENNERKIKEKIQEQSASDDYNINKSDYMSLFFNTSVNSNNDVSQEEEFFVELKKPSKLIINEHLDKFKHQVGDYKGNVKSNCNSSNEDLDITSQKKEIHISDHLLEGIEPLPPDKPVDKNILIDDVPVPSSKKDFPTLLEEKLKECKTMPNRVVHEKIQNSVKRPFLKKGQGLARFKMTQTSKTSPANTKFSNTSLSSKQITNKQINFKNSKNDNVKNENISKSSRNVPSKKCVATTNVVQRQLSLKNVPPPQKACSERTETTLANIQSNIIELNNTDIDLKIEREMEEVRIFELLEEKAENSSLCSTSSTVVAFLQQSTPFKVRQKIRNTKDNLCSPIQQNIMQKASPRRLQLIGSQSTSVNPKSESCINSFWESMSTNNPIESTENMQVLKKQNTCNVLLTSKESDQMSIQNHVEHVYDETNHDIQTSICSSEVDVSLHVRFSEYNEYKTISLSDTSSVSSESLSQKDYDDEKAWSDCSELPDSDIEDQLTKHEKSKTSETRDNKINFISKIKHGKVMYHNEKNQDQENYDFTDTYMDKIMEEDTDKNEIDEKQETIFKSELLKNRLLELEKEIDIFRKESAALSLQRKKLEADRCRFLKEMKEKELIIEGNKKRMEDRMQEEKRKLAREKAALESRLRDSQEKAHQNKLERQQIQDLKQQLEELQSELKSKESRWNAAQARHRSQMRILKLENIKLKEEVEQLRSTKKYNPKSTKKIGPFSNTKALHQINKQLSEETKEIIKNDSSSEDDDKLLKTMLGAINSEHEYKEKDCKIDDHNREDQNHNNKSNTTNIAKQYEQCMQNIIRKRNLYEDLLKDAASHSTEVSSIIKKSNKPKCQKDDQVKNQNKGESDSIKMQFDKDTYSEKNNGIRSNHEINNDSTKTPQKLPLTSISPNYTKEHKTNEQVQCTKHPDGCIEFWYPNGNVKKIFPDEGVTKMLYYNGDVRETQKDGRVKYFYASTRTWHTTMPDGFEILEFQNGQVERRSQNGVVEISFPDGSVQIIQSDGSEKWVLPDGTIAETFANGEKVVILPNGQREVHTESHKRREYPDGTVKLIYPDGIQETRYSNGRIRLKDRDGNLLMDSHP
ncbi:hypothetical protein KPH14_006042 [Odynerus spinipes]|uniref:Centromere protein J n=1 Tax=Odynerus spinipes TaxID=1348599 RepID=A0AAD9VP73_9HYME|nr:hypothetical protein KPH14_006042 [Odynerus spinipes]